MDTLKNTIDTINNQTQQQKKLSIQTIEKILMKYAETYMNKKD